MNKNYTIALIVIVVLGGALYFATAHKGSKQRASTNMPVGQMPMKAVEAPAVSESQQAELNRGAVEHTPTALSFTVNGGNFYFTPNTIKVKKGDTVKIIFKNDGGMHDFVIDEYHVATSRIGTGAEQTVTFVADKAGSFEYYCSVGSHRQMGMKGTLIVE